MSHLRAALTCVLLVGSLGNESRAIEIATVTVGNPGNASDTRYGTPGYGAVAYTYNIGKYEVTAGQYCAFLNAVARSDAHGLYDVYMGSSLTGGCQIQRRGTSGNYVYSVASDLANRPVNYVDFWDACRFANWLSNGQPSGTQGPGTTETGTYTLDNTAGYDGRDIQRNSGSSWGVTSEDEWYKAAYHKNDGVTGNYFDYPTGSDTAPSCASGIPTDAGNSATYAGTDTSPYSLTTVGEHERSASPYGTFDQGGNVMEWNETTKVMGPSQAGRGIRGGARTTEVRWLHASSRWIDSPLYVCSDKGFRVVQLPEPAAIILLTLGGLVVSVRRGIR